MTATTIDPNVLLQSSQAGVAELPPTFYNTVIAAINNHAGILNGGAAGGLPYVDLRNAPYLVVANSTAAAAANALAISQAILDYSGTYARLTLPDGIIYVDAVNFTNKASIYFPSTVGQLTLAGQGMQATSIVRYGVGALGSSQEIRIDGATEIELCDLGIFQQQLTNPDPGQQNHLLMLIDGASHINVHDCYFGKSIGDQIRIVGGSGTIQNAQFSNLLMQGQGVVASTPANGSTGSRSGFAFQTGFDRIEIGNFYIEGVQNSAIDFEPTGTGTNQYVNIHDGVIDNSISNSPTPVSLAGNTGNITSYISMTRVDVINGGIGIRNITHCELDAVRCIIGVTLPGTPTTANILVRNELDSLSLRNLYVQRSAGTAGLLMDIQVSGGPVSIYRGQFLQGTTAGVISIIDSPSVHIDGPSIVYSGGSPASLDAITVQSLNQSVSEVTVDNVRCTSSGGKFNSTLSLYQRAAHAMKPVRASNIQSAGFSSCGVLMSIQTLADFDQTPVITGIQNGADAAWKQVDQGNNPITTIYPCIAGNPADIATYVGQATPLNVLPALQGCLCILKNGNSSALFFNATATDGSGWTQITVP